MKPCRFIPIKFAEDFIGSDGKVKNKIQILRVGKFYTGEKDKKGNPVVVNVSKEYLASMIKNFSEGVRGIDLMLDYSHESDKKAAAWFKELILENDNSELWAEVDWTPKGEEIVKNKEYRYISADFHPDYQDNETLKKFGPTLLGAGLTNRPVVKRMEPVILSENSKKEGDDMPVDQKDYENLQEENKKLAKKLADMEAKMKKEEEDKKMQEQKDQEAKELKEKNEKFDTMLKTGRVVEAQRKPYLENDAVKFAELQAEVKLDEKADTTNGTNKTDETKETSSEKLARLAEDMAKKEKMTLSEATRAVLADKANTALAEGYKKETAVYA